MEVTPPRFRLITPPPVKEPAAPTGEPFPTTSSRPPLDAGPLVDDDVSKAAGQVLTGSTRASTRRANPDVVRSIAPLAGMILAGLGLALHAWRSPKTQAWLLATEQAEDLATPLCRIMARRMPEELAGESDVADALEFGVKATGYGIASLMEERNTPPEPSTFNHQPAEADA